MLIPFISRGAGLFVRVRRLT